MHVVLVCLDSMPPCACTVMLLFILTQVSHYYHGPEKDLKCLD